MTYLLLMFEFFKAGLFAIGGGLATLPYLMEMTVNHPDWFTQNELLNMIAISESTPGPIGINMATYAGFHVGGLWGAALATFSLVLPSYLVILVVVRVLKQFRESRLVAGGLAGLHPAVTGLIAAAGFSVLWASLMRVTDTGNQFQWIAFVLFITLLAATQLKPLRKIHPLAYIAVGAVLGVVLGL